MPTPISSPTRPPGASWRSTPASSCTTSRPTRSCCACSPSSGSPPRSPRCRCRPATRAPVWSGRARSGRAACSRPRPTSATPATCGCWRRSRASTGGRDQLLDRDDERGPTSPTSPCGEFLDRGRFTPYFRRHFVEPLVAAVWSCDPAVATDYPAAYLFTFLRHHGMLGVFGSPTWRTVAGGSRSYVDRVAAAIEASGGNVRTGAPVTEVSEGDASVTVRTAHGEEEYDAVVVATHPEQALALLADPSPVQRKVLGALPYARNTALLHTDTRLLPKARRAWASWNFRRPVVDQDSVQVTYDLTRLQRLPDPDPLPGHPRRRAPRRPRDGHRPPRLRAPALQPHLGRRPRPARRGRHPAGAVRRGLPRLGVPRGRRPLRARGGRGARARAGPTPGRAPRRRTRRPSRTPGARRSAAPSATARTCGSSTSTGSRSTGRLGVAPREVRRARPLRRPLRHDPRRTGRLPDEHGLDVRDGRVADGRAPARARPLLQPDHRVLVLARPGRDRAAPTRPWSRCTTRTATATPTWCRPTPAAPDGSTRRCTSRRSTAPTATTEVVAPPPEPSGKLSISISLRPDEGSSFTATLVGEPADGHRSSPSPPCAAPSSSGCTASCSGSADCPSGPAPITWKVSR